MKNFSAQKGEVGTILALVGLVVIGVGIVVGGKLVEVGTRFLPKASTPLIPHLALGKPTTASGTYQNNLPSNAVDGNLNNMWNSGAHPPGWIEIDLGTEQTIGQIKLHVAQLPNGQTTHKIEGAGNSRSYFLIETVSGYTTDGQVLERNYNPPKTGVRYLRVTTTSSPSWVAWREIEVHAPASVSSPTPTSTPLGNNPDYAAVVVSDARIVADYAISHSGYKIADVMSGFPKEYADKKIYLPRITKNAYVNNRLQAGIQIQNTEYKQTVVTLDVYNEAGSKVLSKNYSLSPFGFVKIYTPDLSDFPSGVYSGVLSSSQAEIVADVTLSNLVDEEGGQRGWSYEGIPEKNLDQTVYVPVLTRESYGFESGIIVQNPSSSSLTAEVEITGQNYRKTCSFGPIASFAHKVIYLPQENCFSDLPKPNFFFSAKVSGKDGQKLAVVHSHSDRGRRLGLEENGRPAKFAGNRLFIPRVYNNYYNWSSSFHVQNITEETAQVSVKYYMWGGVEVANVPSVCTNFTLPPLGNKAIYIPNVGGTSCLPSGNTNYSAIIESDKPITGAYHAENLAESMSIGTMAFGHNLIEPSQIYFIPRVYKDYGGWNSSIDIQNTEKDQLAHVTVYIINNEGKVVTSKVFTIARFATADIYIPSHFPQLPAQPTNDYPLAYPKTWNIEAKVVCPNGATPTQKTRLFYAQWPYFGSSLIWYFDPPQIAPEENPVFRQQGIHRATIVSHSSQNHGVYVGLEWERKEPENSPRKGEYIALRPIATNPPSNLVSFATFFNPPTYMVQWQRDGLPETSAFSGGKLVIEFMPPSEYFDLWCPLSLPTLTPTPTPIDKLVCGTDSDCGCGLDRETGQCAVENINYLGGRCNLPDFCGGITGNCKPVCLNNRCTLECHGPPLPTRFPFEDAKLLFTLVLPDMAVNEIPAEKTQIEVYDGDNLIQTTYGPSLRKKHDEGSLRFFVTSEPAVLKIPEDKSYTLVIKLSKTLSRKFKEVNLKRGRVLDCDLNYRDCGDLFINRLACPEVIGYECNDEWYVKERYALFAGDSDGFNKDSGSYNRIDIADFQKYIAERTGVLTTLSADFNLDGRVDTQDLGILARNFGKIYKESSD